VREKERERVFARERKMNRPAEPRIEGDTAEKKGREREGEAERAGMREQEGERVCVKERVREKEVETSRTKGRGSHCKSALPRTDRLRIYRPQSIFQDRLQRENERERGGGGERERECVCVRER